MSKKLVIGLTSLVLVAAVAIGGTMALMTAKTDEKKNVFTVGAGITGELKEPLYDHDNFTGANAVTIPADHVMGKTSATNFTAGTKIDKDPAVANTTAGTGDNATAWVAVKLSYTDGADGAMAYADIAKFADVAFDTANWVAKDNTNTVFYYKTTLAAGKKTETLFNDVTIKADALSQAYVTSLGNAATQQQKDLVMKNFDIKINAYMVQSANIDEAAARAELDKLMA